MKPSKLYGYDGKPRTDKSGSGRDKSGPYSNFISIPD